MQNFNQEINELPNGIMLGNDKKFRWVAEVNLWKNPIVLGTTLKVIALTAFLTGLFIFVLLSLGESFASAFAFFWRYLLFSLLAMSILGVVSYFLLAAIYGSENIACYLRWIKRD